MSTLEFAMLLVATLASSVSAVLHVLGQKNATAEKVAEEIDSAEAAVKPIIPVAPPKA